MSTYAEETVWMFVTYLICALQLDASLQTGGE